jgi:predicted RNase H-like HicB family nuclease
MDKRYTYTVQISEQEGGYLVDVPASPGCHTWGKTYDEAVVNAQEAIQGFLETLTKDPRGFRPGPRRRSWDCPWAGDSPEIPAALDSMAIFRTLCGSSSEKSVKFTG